MSNEMVRLEKCRPTWHAEAVLPPIPVTRAWSRWRSARGFLIHRARHATIYRDNWNDRQPRMAVTYLCGNTGNRAIPFREECSEGTSPCGKCEGLWLKETGRIS